jgi:hypothetical protein
VPHQHRRETIMIIMIIIIMMIARAAEALVLYAEALHWQHHHVAYLPRFLSLRRRARDVTQIPRQCS